MDNGTASERWELLMDRAISFLNLLDDSPEIYELSNDQIDSALSHIEKLLKEIEKPVKLSELDKRTNRGLALFCNQEHANVSDFLGNLERTGFDRMPGKKAKPNNRLLIFSKVRKAVKKALGPTDNSQNGIIGKSDIMGRNPSKLLNIQIIRGNPDSDGQQ